ncbi:hypothetical protein PVAP13_1KG004100 [Panicum virgatum]|uniref:APOSTART n=2 Tax=Panicum virgatum TaxID=38727 RepID=A0A8T0X8P7_PANVG|nr:hypothetical protein PVAP13_1KG004100 [Panicum virgatum]
MPNMLGSSASRREARSGELHKTATMSLRDAAAKIVEAPKVATMSLRDAATKIVEAPKAATPKPSNNMAAVVREAAAAAVRYEGWMVRYGRRKIGRSFFHTRYFVLDSKLLAYYKKKPKDNMVPLKSLLIDSNCRVEDRGLKTHHGQMIYVLCIYNKKEKEHQITMGAYDIEDAMAWKKKIELIIDQQQDSMTAKNRKAFASIDFDMELGEQFSFSDHDSAAEDDEERPILTRRTTIGNGPPDSIHDWTKEPDIGLFSQNNPNHVHSKKNWRLLRCQNGLRIFEELLEVDYLARSCSRAMRAVGVVEATCEAIFGLVMSMDVTRYEWDCSFRHGSLVEEIDGHTAILYHSLQLHWCPMLVWPRDLCYARYWRRNDDGSYVVLFRSVEHPNCGRQRGFVRAFIESGGFKISPLKCHNGRPRTQVQHLMQIDLKGWFLNYSLSFQYHSLLQILNCVAGLREYFSQTDEIHITPRIPVMETMFDVDSEPKGHKTQEVDSKSKPVYQGHKNMGMIDEESDEDDDYQVPEADLEEDPNKFDNDAKCTDEPPEKIDLSCFSGILHHDVEEKSRNCWTVPDSKIFKVRSKNFPHDKSKIPAASYLMELAAIDWFKDTKRMDNVARQKGCVAQVAAEKGMHTFVVNIQIPGSTQYSLVMYFVTSSLKKGSLLQRFFDGDDEFRNSRLKLIPSVPKGSWIVRQSVGSTPCLLGKAVDCSYFRGHGYLEVDVDIGSSAVANGVLGLVFGVVTTLVVDMAFLIQANTYEELPEQVIGAARLAHVEPATAVVPDLENAASESGNNDDSNNNASSEDDVSKKTN